MCFYLCFARKLSKTEMQKIVQKRYPAKPLAVNKWLSSTGCRWIWKLLREFWPSVRLWMDRRSVKWLTERPSIPFIGSEISPVTDVEEITKYGTMKASTDRMCISGPCCWSINWIIEYARFKDEEDDKYGPIEAVDGSSFHRPTLFGVVDWRCFSGQTFLILNSF